MITDTGTISENGVVKAQLQIVDGEDETRKVQLYGKGGVILCEIPFYGDNDKGYEIGQALYIGYTSGWTNAKYHYSLATMKAMDTPSRMEIE